MAFGPSSLVEELWRAPPCHFYLIWEIGRQRHMEQIWWRRSRYSQCVSIQAVDDSRWAQGEPDPPSLMTRHARSGRHVWWKVEWDLTHSTFTTWSSIRNCPEARCMD
jgi:hypothetical protein